MTEYVIAPLLLATLKRVETHIDQASRVHFCFYTFQIGLIFLADAQRLLDLINTSEETLSMATYLIQIAFTAESIQKLVAHPENRLSTMIPLVEKMGGKFIGSWISFGQYDSTAVIEMPDDISIKAFEFACMAGGGLRFFHLTQLMTFDDGVAAMHKAQQVAYDAPA